MQQPTELFGTVSVTRYAAGSYVSGDWSEGGSVSLSITACVQPMPAERMATLPEGRRGTAGIIVFTGTALRTADEAAHTSADRITWDGHAWEVVEVDNLSTGIGLEEAHYEVLGVRK
jgi:hypothetical protein